MEDQNRFISINFANKRLRNIPVRIKNIQIPRPNTVQYMGITLEARLRWKAIIQKNEIRYKIV